MTQVLRQHSAAICVQTAGALMLNLCPALASCRRNVKSPVLLSQRCCFQVLLAGGGFHSFSNGKEQSKGGLLLSENSSGFNVTLTETLGGAQGSQL